MSNNPAASTHGLISRDRRQNLGLVVAAATLAPATLTAQNAVFGPSVMKLSGIALAQVLGGLGAVAVGKRLGINHRVATVLSGVLLVAFTLGGGVVRSPNTGIVVLAFTAFLIALTLVARWSRDDRVWTWLGNTAWLMLIIMIGRAVLAVVASVPSSSSEVLPIQRVRNSPGASSFYLIVLDGYPGSVAELPELSPIIEEFVNDLTERGFNRTQNARANYNATFASISTMLSLDHDLRLSQRGLVEAFEKIRGDNRLARGAQDVGYRYVHVESGWSGSTCGRFVDLCYKGLLIDETMEALFDLSVLGTFWRRSASTEGALNALANLSDHIADDDGGDFVFAHVLLPHPPLQLKTGCSRTFEPELDVRFLNSPGTSQTDLRLIKSAFLEQIQCVNNLILSLMEQLPREWPVVIASDHGTDFRGQALKVPSQWDERDIEERFSNLTVTRLPESCQIGEQRDLINVMRSAASCVLGLELKPIAPHFEIVPYYGSLQIGPRVLTESDLGY